MTDTPRLTDTRTKKAGEAITYEIPWWSYLGRTWRPGERFIAATFVRPTRPNGFEYECTTAGQTAYREPQQWPTTVGAMLIDGSVTWTCRAIGNSAVDTISISVWTADVGLTLAGQQVNATKQLTSVRISAGLAGQDYTVENEVTTASGDEYIFTLKIKVTID